MTVNELRDNYREFDDDKILLIARKDMDRLSPEVLVILKEEIIKRNLSQEIELQINDILNPSKESIESLFERNSVFYAKSSIVNGITFFSTLMYSILAFKLLIRGIAVISIPLVFYGLRLFFKKKSMVLELNKEYMVVYLFSSSRLSFLFKFITGSLNKLTVNYTEVSNFEKGTGILNDRTYYMYTKNMINSKSKFKSLLHVLSYQDMNMVKKLLAHKNIPFKN